MTALSKVDGIKVAEGLTKRASGLRFACRYTLSRWPKKNVGVSGIWKKGGIVKKSFPGYFAPSKNEIDSLWENCLFIVDANILLNLYRYSDSTRNEFFTILHAMQDRLWLPHRAAQEYFNNRLGVISQQERTYEEAIKTLRLFQSDLSNTDSIRF